jgi:hypothetical protein
VTNILAYCTELFNKFGQDPTFLQIQVGQFLIVLLKLACLPVTYTLAYQKIMFNKCGQDPTFLKIQVCQFLVVLINETSMLVSDEHTSLLKKAPYNLLRVWPRSIIFIWPVPSSYQQNCIVCQ